MNLLRATITVGCFTGISRVLGFCRDILVAASLGAGLWADIFFVAFKLPNLFRRLFAEGAFSAAFIPIFVGKLEKGGHGSAQHFIDESFAILLWFLLVFVIIVELFMPYLILGVAPGFFKNPDKFQLAIFLTRVTFPYVLFISLVSLFSGVLNSLGRFSAAAATPIFLNLCLIGSVIWLAPYVESPAHALSWGIAIAGVIQLCWIIWAVFRAGFIVHFIFPRFTSNTLTLIRRMMPVAVGAGIYQINLVIDTIIASFLPEGSISYLFYADRVTQLPLGIVGVAVGTALLPLLTRQIKSGDSAGAVISQQKAIELSLFFILPAATALAIIAGPIIQTLFERQEFDAISSVATANAVAIYALGLPAYILVKSLTPGFFSREDTLTPVKISIFCVGLNLLLNLLLMGPFLHVGIAMATAVASWVNAIFLACILIKRGHLLLSFRLFARISKIILSATIMGIGLWLVMFYNPALFSGGELSRFLALLMLVVIGLITFILTAQLLGVMRFAEIKVMMRDHN